jgi:integrase
LDDVARLLAIARPEPMQHILALAIATGLRRGELLGLRWQDVDTEAATLAVHQTVTMADGHYEVHPVPKTKSSARTIGIDAGLIEILLQWRARLAEQMLRLGIGWPRDALVFPDLRAGSATAPKNRMSSLPWPPASGTGLDCRSGPQDCTVFAIAMPAA